MPSRKVGRMQVRIETTATAEPEFEKLICDAGSALSSETRMRRKKPDGRVLYDIVCDDQAELDKLLFKVEKIRGAAVHQCV